MSKEAPHRNEDTTEASAEPSSTTVFDIEPYVLAGQTLIGVIEVLSDVLDEDPLEMQPLHSVVDCDAIDRLFHPPHSPRHRNGVTLTFPYDAYTVTISADGCVVLTERIC